MLILIVADNKKSQGGLMNFIYKTILSIILALYSLSSHAVVLDIQGGILMGASEVDVNSIQYDVAFQNGTCVTLFDGCDNNSDFSFALPFNDPSLIILAMESLLNQVFLDVASGNFDSDPETINGCSNFSLCAVLTPAFVNLGSGGVGIVTAFNYSEEFRDRIGSGGGGSSGDTTPTDFFTYAVWSPTPENNPDPSVSVPEPSTLLLFAFGLFGLLTVNKKYTVST